MALCFLCSAVVGKDFSCAWFHARLYPKKKIKDEKKRPNALMLTVPMELGTHTYFNHSSDTFGKGSMPWFSSLVAALSRTEEEMDAGKEPSLLILDDFDSEGKDDSTSRT